MSAADRWVNQAKGRPADWPFDADEGEAPHGRCPTCNSAYAQVYGSTGDIGCDKCWTCRCGTTLSDDEGQCPACHADDYEAFYDR